MPLNVSAFANIAQLARPRIDYSLIQAEAEPSFDWGFDLDMPFEHLSLFARHLDTAAPIPKLPVFGIAGFAVSAATRGLLTNNDREAQPAFPKLPLGVIGTDHVGYGSFDLWPLRQITVLKAIREALIASGLLGQGNKPRLTIDLSFLHVLPFKDPTLVFDALTVGDRAHNFICLRMDIDDAMLANRAEWPSMPAMQSPGILDWRLSPGSFSMSGALLVGENGCETLLPANLATRLIRFRQIVRTAKRADLQTLGIPGMPPGAMSITLGYAVQYNTEWFPLGHSLGQIAYSLPLAPGEKMKIAIVDWTRRDTAKRTEQTAEKEDLEHAALRERSLSEAVSMVVRESQSGSSFMAGGALSAGAGIPLGAVSLGVGAAASVGGASSNSQGMRSVVGNTTQQISDAFHQASSAQRELNSTVVIQGAQAEAAEARTRVVANYNHSHALTILYYEVLQHQRLLTRPASARPVLFLQHDVISFDYDSIETHRGAIANVLLDESLKGCLDIVDLLACKRHNLEREKQRREAQGDPLDNALLADMTFTIRSGDVGPWANVVINLVTKAGGQRIPCHFVDSSLIASRPGGVEYHQDEVINLPPIPLPHVLENIATKRIKPNEEFLFVIRPSVLTRWKNIAAFEIGQTIEPAQEMTRPDTRAWLIEDLRVTTGSATATWTMLTGRPEPNAVPYNVGSGWLSVPVKGFIPPIEDVEDLLTDEQRCCLRRLLRHLKEHAPYYSRAIWLAERPADRAQRLSPWMLLNSPLLDIVENTVYDFVDGYAIMPVIPGGEDVLGTVFDDTSLSAGKATVFPDYIEQIITLPARGVFAEAKLGHCNASEVIDPTRFWDWQTSPIPDEAPEIAATSTDSRSQDQSKGLIPTPFPQSIVNIATPQALPDPTGLNAAAGVVSALGPFRDMSGMKELGPLLQTLSNNATQLASQGMKNAQTAGMMNTIRSAKEIPEEKRAELISELLTGQVKTTPEQGQSTRTTDTTGGTTPTPQTSPTADSGSPPTLSTEPKPKSIPAPTPQRSPALSSKTHLLVFAFAFDTNDVMLGRWNVELLSGTDQRRENRTINTVGQVSGVDIGNRMEMYVEDTFGGDNDVHVHIHGTIVGQPQSLSAGTRKYEIEPWSESRDFMGVIVRASFSKTRTIQVTQATEPVDFKISRTVQETQAETKIKGSSANIEVGVENAVEAGGTIGVAEGKEAVKISAKGTYGVHSDTQNLTQGTNGFTEEVSFKGRKVSPSAPTIKAAN